MAGRGAEKQKYTPKFNIAFQKAINPFGVVKATNPVLKITIKYQYNELVKREHVMQEKTLIHNFSKEREDNRSFFDDLLAFYLLAQKISVVVHNITIEFTTDLVTKNIRSAFMESLRHFRNMLSTHRRTFTKSIIPVSEIVIKSPYAAPTPEGNYYGGTPKLTEEEDAVLSMLGPFIFVLDAYPRTIEVHRDWRATNKTIWPVKDQPVESPLDFYDMMHGNERTEETSGAEDRLVWLLKEFTERIEEKCGENALLTIENTYKNNHAGKTLILYQSVFDQNEENTILPGFYKFVPSQEEEEEVEEEAEEKRAQPQKKTKLEDPDDPIEDPDEPV